MMRLERLQSPFVILISDALFATLSLFFMNLLRFKRSIRFSAMKEAVWSGPLSVQGNRTKNHAIRVRQTTRPKQPTIQQLLTNGTANQSTKFQHNHLGPIKKAAFHLASLLKAYQPGFFAGRSMQPAASQLSLL